MKIDKPGVYDMPAEEYHADPAPDPSLSSSIAKLLVNQTPQHAWFKHPRLNPNQVRKEEEKFDIGNAGHSLMLNDAKAFAILNFDDWRKADAKAARERARNEGKIPLLSHQFSRVEAMVEVGRMQLAAHADASNAFTNGKPERTLIWTEEHAGMTVWFRARLDWLPNAGDVFDDYKTTEASANPDAWQRIIFSVGHDLQASFYRRGIRALDLSRNPHFRFIVQETQPPNALSVIELENDALELADRRIESAIRKWVWCRKHGEWPGYPAHTCYVGAPSWHETSQMDRELRNADLARERRVDPDILALAMKFQAPI